MGLAENGASHPRSSRLLDRESATPLHDLLEPFLGSWNEGSQDHREAIANEVFLRYNATLRHAVPWLERAIPLANSEIVEIGCGTGSSSAAFAQAARAVRGYDISERYVEAARRRAEFFQLENVEFSACRPEVLADTLADQHPAGIDIILFFAVLEHCTSEEVLRYLTSCWNLLRPGGILAVIETPNRLTYFDLHTSQLPFFQQLPADLRLQYFRQSPRASIVEELESALGKSKEEAVEVLTRLGAGISYHEFQLALGTSDLASLLVCDGFEDEMLQWFPANYEERLLQTFFQQHSVAAPLGFTRHVLNLAFQKPVDPQQARSGNSRDRTQEVANFEQRRFPAQIEQSLLFQRFAESTSVVREMSGPEWNLAHVENMLTRETERGLSITPTTDDPNLVLSYALDRALLEGESLLVLVELTTDVHTAVQIFYRTHSEVESKDFDPRHARAAFITAGRNIVVLGIEDPKMEGGLRIDPGFHLGEYLIHRIGLRIG
jgi:SAM-dependent methyltransferase